MKVFLFLYLFLLSGYLRAQEIKFKTNNTIRQLISVTAHVSDFAHFEQSEISFDLKQGKDLIVIPYVQPQFVELTCNWSNHKKTYFQFLASSNRYELVADRNFKLTLISNEITEFKQKYDNAEMRKRQFHNEQDKLLQNIDYSKSTEITDLRINFIQDSIALLIDSYNRQKYEENLNNMFGLFSLCQYAEYPSMNLRRDVTPDNIRFLLKRLDKKVQLSSVGIALNKKLTIAKQLLPGKPFQYDINLLDTASSVTNLSIFKGKYLFIDFWASWCVPCREQSNYLIKANQRYKNQNFQIISISLDNESQRNYWMRSIYRDKINLWPQFSDFKQRAKLSYNIKLIPANILIDHQGIIIGRNLVGQNILDKLEEILH